MILGQSIQRFLSVPWVTVRGLVSQAADAGVLLEAVPFHSPVIPESQLSPKP